MGVLVQSSTSNEESAGSVSTHDEASDHALLPHAESTKDAGG